MWLSSLYRLDLNASLCLFVASCRSPTENLLIAYYFISHTRGRQPGASFYHLKRGFSTSRELGRTWGRKIPEEDWNIKWPGWIFRKFCPNLMSGEAQFPCLRCKGLLLYILAIGWRSSTGLVTHPLIQEDQWGPSLEELFSMKIPLHLCILGIIWTLNYSIRRWVG